MPNSNSSQIELLCQLTHVTSLQELSDLTYQITGNPLFISDLAHTILAYTKCVEVADETWQTNVVRAHLECNTLTQDREVSFVHINSTAMQGPVLVQDDYVPYPRIIKTLVSNGRAVGVMVLTSYCQPFAETDLDLMELISAFAVPQMLKERFTISTDSKTAENYFIKLLDGAQFTQERVDKRLNILGHERHPYSYVLCICAKQLQEKLDRADLHPLIAKFNRLPGCCTFFYNATLICVFGSEEEMSRWDSQVPEMNELLIQEGLIAGVSRRISGLHLLRTFYLQALQAMEVGVKLERLTRFHLYDNLSSFLLLQQLPSRRLYQFCHQKIQELASYDLRFHADLCQTLQVYLEQTKSLSKTAEILFIHRNTVRYRIKKCMELMHTDFEAGNEIFAYIFSLHILEYEKKFCGVPGGIPSGDELQLEE